MWWLLLACVDPPAAVGDSAVDTASGDTEDTATADTACAEAWHPDADGDGYGDGDATVTACEAPEGHVADGTDCDDAAADAHPSGTEVCGDGLDGDCDGRPGACRVTGEATLADAGTLLLGELAGDRAGIPSAAGDVDGDGFADVLVRASGRDDFLGAVHVVSGPIVADMSLSVADAMLLGTEGESGPYAAAAAGDVDGDGFGDVVVGSPARRGGGDDDRAFVFRGPLDGAFDESAAACGLWQDGGANAWLGRVVAGVGDLDGDGLADVAVAAPLDTVDLDNEGVVYLLKGGCSGWIDPSTLDRIEGTQNGEMLGTSLAAAGDVDGDGYGDLWIGADVGVDDGASLFHGPISGTRRSSAAVATIEGSGAGEFVAVLGDTDGDGRSDLLLGDPQDGAHGYATGGAWVVPGPLNGSVEARAVAVAQLVGEAQDDQAGWAVAGPGDVDGDGFADVLVGAPGNDALGTDAGAAYLLYGPVAGEVALGSADVVLRGTFAGDEAGYALAGGGDLDGDGLPDLAVGAPSADVSGTTAGLTAIVSLAGW